MAVIVSAIFGVCWPPDLILHVVANGLSPVVFSVTYTMIMFNSAVNPFAYALINQRFREKIKKMIRCRSSSVSPLVHATREPQDIEMANNTTQLSDTGEPTATK